jgi:thiamine-monophosphate kinase
MIGEDDLIARHFAPIAGPGGLGLLDDAALLSPLPGHDLVITKDALVAGVHFFADDPPGAIARKALRVNLSDLAAKGAEPLGFLLGLGLPPGTDEAWIAAFAKGLGEDAKERACPLLGGDTVRSPGGLTLSITAIGTCEAGTMTRRGTGRAGHLLAVTGTIGDAALGLRLRLEPEAEWAKALSPKARAFLLDRYLLPRPRNALAASIHAHASAAMDVSDGLLGDAVKLAASARRGLAPRIALQGVPLSEAAREAVAIEPSLMRAALTGGDDYEILIAAEPGEVDALLAGCAASGCPAHVIGTLEESAAPEFIDADGKGVRFGALKFEHDWKS